MNSNALYSGTFYPNFGRRLRAMAGGLAVALTLAGGLTEAWAQTDDFNDGNDNGWLRVDLMSVFGLNGFSSWGVTNGRYVLRCEGLPTGDAGPGRLGSIWNNTEYYYTNFYAAVDIVGWEDTPNMAVGLIARAQDYFSMGVALGYTLTYEPSIGDFYITTMDPLTGGIIPTVGTKLDLQTTNTYRLVFLGRGDYLEGRCYLLGGAAPELLATISANEPSYPSGWCGLVVSNTQGTYDKPVMGTFDNYMAQAEEPPPLTIQKNGNDVEIGWPGWASSFQLQSSATLAPNSWTPVTSGIVSNEFGFKYTTPAAGKAYYRLSLN